MRRELRAYLHRMLRLSILDEEELREAVNGRLIQPVLSGTGERTDPRSG